MNVRFVLVEPRFAGNIGAAARAIKVMGFTDLHLVDPRALRDPEATRMAADAADVLETATVVSTLDESLRDCSLSFATSGRRRSADWPSVPVDEAAAMAARHAGQVAFLFGPEPSGLSSEAVYRAHYRSFIPTGTLGSSLNLAQAVQVVAYELRRARPLDPPGDTESETPATSEVLQNCYAELRSALVELDFPKRDPDHLMLKFRRIFNRAGLSEAEVAMLHGLFARIRQRVARP